MKSRINCFVTLVSLVVVLASLAEITHARPAAAMISRHKRTSDQRLAELQSLMALSKMRGKLVTVPVGFGRVDPAKIGRRRRSSVEFDLQRLRRFLQAIAADAESNKEEESQEDNVFSSMMRNEETHEDEIADQLG